MLKKYFFLGNFVVVFFCTLGISSSYALAPAENIRHYQVSAYLGGTTSTIKVGDLSLIGETEQLNPQGTNQSNFTWGFGAAYRFLPPQVLRNNLLQELSLGLEFYAFKTTQAGDVWQYQLPEMNNFTYQLPIQSYRLLATNEITFHPIVPKAFPFFEWGVGFANNTVSFNETPRPTYLSPGLNIINHTQYQFAYTLGGGVKFDLSDWGKLTQGLEFSLRYLYANLGNANTGTTANIPLAAPISVSLYTQAWVAGLSYAF